MAPVPPGGEVKEATQGARAMNAPEERAAPDQASQYGKSNAKRFVRAERRAHERAAARRTSSRTPGRTGKDRLDRWQRESWVSLVQQAGRLGIELETVADRKRVVIALQREQAALAGVSPAVWACSTRKRRGALMALGHLSQL
jgi:predicted  nucleic acid-binding Zn-ribbon protein